MPYGWCIDQCPSVTTFPMATPNCYAVIPAAGESVRMGGRDKLLLKWTDGTVIEHVLRSWLDSRVQRVIVVVRKNNTALQKACQRLPKIELLVPDDDPADMKHSIQFALHYLTATCQPQKSDRWMTAPADVPTLKSSLIDALIETSTDCDSIIAPRYGGRGGHPLSFPWSFAPHVFSLKDDEGINKLLTGRAVHWIDFPDKERPRDLDTPEEYSRMLNQAKRD